VNQNSSLASQAVDAILWRLLQNLSTAVVSFVIQTWLARLLLPEHYGVVALTGVFITVSMVFVQTGFTSAIIQKPSLTEVEISSVYFSSIAFACLLYGLIYLSAPFVSSYYHQPVLKNVLRVQGILILIASLYSVPASLLQRNLQLKKTFIASIISSIVQGFVGISMAKAGHGVWALVFSSIAHAILYCILLLVLCAWKPKRVFSFDAIRSLFPFSIRILMINLLNTLFNNVKSLIIGRVYSSELLGYYNRGYQIPVLIMNNIDGAMNAVTFPVLAKFQHDYTELSIKLRRSLQVSIYFVWPAMIGLIVVANPLIRVLLTDKWLMSVPFVQLTALICMLWPFSVFTHAINAIGKSGLALILNIISKTLSLIVMIASYRFGIYVFIGSSFFTSLITTSITIIVASRVIGFSRLQIVKDCLPTFLASAAMGICVYFVGTLAKTPLIMLGIQLCVGVLFYLAITWAFKFRSFLFVLSYLKSKVIKK
jgi:teichuronic acid exporter